MKVMFPLLALTVFLFFAYFTHPAKRDETPQSAEKQDFVFKDSIHGTTITGSWINKDYIVKMEITSIRLDMKLVFEFSKNMDSADINSSPDGPRTPKHGKIQKFKESPECTRNATCHDFETFRPRTPGFIVKIWDFSWTMMTGALKKCCDSTVAMATRTWNGVTWSAEVMWDEVISLADGIWNGVSWMADRVRNEVTWLADGVWNGLSWLTVGVWNGVIMLAERFWNGFTWLVDGVWNGATWLINGVWNGVSMLAEWIWNGLTWTGSLFLPGNYVTDCVVNFYYGYIDSHVNYIAAHIVASTQQDVLYITSAVFVLNFALLVIYLMATSAVNLIRRLWQARKDRITATNLPTAPKKSIWRPKPKKKRRRNRNVW